jgi:hypothetical protein
MSNAGQDDWQKEVSRLMKFLSRGVLAALAVTVATAAAAAPAHAALLTPTPTDCGTPDVDQVFAPWKDRANYFVAPGGDFESGAKGWTLSGGAKIVADQEPWDVGGTDGSRALELPAGATAVSPVVCMGLEEPTIRMFARSTGALKVSATVKTNIGLNLTLPLGLDTGAAWAPGAIHPVVFNTAGLGQKVPVQIVLSGSSGTSRVDDLYVDPWRAR